MLSRIFLRTGTSIRTCSRLFPIVYLRYVFTRFKGEKMPSLLAFVACESKNNLKIFPFSLIKKLLFRYISCNFLIMVFIIIVSLSLSSNKLGNNLNCDTNLLMPTCSLNNNFRCLQEFKIWLSGALFEQRRFSFDNLAYFVFWTKGELFYKNPLKRSVLKLKFQNPRNMDKKNQLFHDPRRNNSKFTTE